MKKIILIFILSFNYVLFNSQIGNTNIVPPSPNASSISKFVENEVSLSSGTVNINVPIYEFAVDGVTVNVNLAYNSKGVMVAEDASNVGLGWTLNAGGVITRQVRGLPDEAYRGYMNYNYIKDYSSDYSVREYMKIEEEIENTRFDYYPDLYHLTLLGKTTKIIFDNYTKKPVMQSLNDMKIEAVFHGGYSGHAVQSFIITDESGNKYYFESDYDVFQNSERIFPGPEDPSIFTDSDYRTAWYLSRIKTANNKEITFSYNASYITTYSKVDQEYNSFGTTDIYKTQLKQYSISQIVFPNGRIVFDESSGREDLQGGKRLESIRVFNDSGTTKKKVKLNYEYRTGGSVDGVHPNLSIRDPDSAKRLFLTSVDFKNKNDSKVSSYSFEYDPTLLPSKYSTSIDYWGYYNGFNNGYSLLLPLGLKRREVNFAKLQAGVLKKITYPTGGYSQFQYEPNYTQTPSYWSETYLAEYKNDSNFFNDVSVGITKDAYFYIPSFTSPNSVGYYQRNFSITGNPIEQVYMDVNANIGSNCTSVETVDCPTKVRLYNAVTNELVATITQGIQNISLYPGDYYFKVTNDAFTYFDAYQDPNGFENNPFSIVLKWRKKKVLSYGFIGGGLRISSINNYDGVKSVTKNYSYNWDNGNSSGKLLGIPDYFYIIETILNGYNYLLTQRAGSIKPISNFNAGGLVSYSRVTESITENLVSKGSNIYTFTNFPDMGEFYKSHYPQMLPTDLGYLRGIPIEIQTKDATGKTLRKIVNEYKFQNFPSPHFCYTDWNGTQKCENANEFLIPSSGGYTLNSHYLYSKDITSIPMYIGGLNIPLNDPFDYNKYRASFFVNLFYKKNSTEVTDFFDNSSVMQKTYFNYDQPFHHQITSQQEISSDTSQSLTTYQYAHEKANQYLIDKNMIGIPLETKVIKKKDSLDANGKILSQVETKYPVSQAEADTKTAGLPVAYEILSKDLQNTTMSKEVTYTKYDPSNGNLQEYKLKDLTPVAIIWGYNNTQPIAKIEGALYDNVKTLSEVVSAIMASNTDYTQGTQISEDTLISALDTFRKLPTLLNAQITTYTYDPLIGVRSITTPSGIREYYFYDAANRLEFIKTKDENGNFKIMKEFKYNYKQ